MNDVPENTHTNLTSDTLDYLRGVESSTCLLLPTTPSPSPMDFKHPLSEEMNEGPFLTLNDEPIVNLQNSDASGADSSSSVGSTSMVQDPVSAQLINNISMLDYQTLSKNGDIISMSQTEDCKLNGNVGGGGKKLPNFVNWNWTLIRKIFLWIILSGLVACLAAIVTMICTMPIRCNPDLPWHQGKVFYEVFPASFKDSNNDGTGDLKGLLKNLDYIEGLGASAIRLNSIFEAIQYPEHYYNTTSLLKIDRSLGVLKDFQELVSIVHSKNMSVILDLPVISMAAHLNSNNVNLTSQVLLANTTLVDPTSSAIAYWSRAQSVDGFYLKNLELFVDDVNFGKSLQLWKQIIGQGKIFIASEASYNKAKDNALNVLLSRVDLIDVNIDLQNGIVGLKDRIDNILNGSLWAKPHYPWVHWNIGSINSERVSTKHVNNTLALTALEFILPGTVSLFYGDEIGLGGIDNVESDFHEHEHIHNLVPMSFANSDKNDKSTAILSWVSNSVLDPKFHYLDVIKSLTKLKLSTPTLYLRAILKEGSLSKNTKIRKTVETENLIVIERWYPRRSTCVFIGNLGSEPVTTDLSTLFYGGTVVASTNTSLVGQLLYFDHDTFPPNSAIILKLEK